MARYSLVVAFASTVALDLELILLPVASSETAIVGGGSAANDEAAAPLACPSLAARMDGAATAVLGATSPALPDALVQLADDATDVRGLRGEDI